MTPLIIAILMALGMPDYAIATNSNTPNAEEPIETNIIIEDHPNF